MTNETNIFEYATRSKLRFDSTKGALTVEQLWDAPLRSTDGFNLDAIARAANKVFKEATEESFVATTRTPAHTRLGMTLDVVKRVIEVKLDEEAKAKLRSENKAKREVLLKALAEKQEGKLSAMSEKDLKKQIADLDD